MQKHKFISDPCYTAWNTGAGGAPAWRQTLAAGILTLAVFVLLPFSHEIGRRTRRDSIEVRPINTLPVKLEPPPPEKPLPTPPPPKPAEPTQNQPKPRPAPPAELPRPQITLPFSINLASAPELGDFALDFALDTRAENLAPAPAQSIFGLEDLDQPPRPIRQPPPVYPFWGRTGNIEGFVDLEFTVTAAGKVQDIMVVEAYPAGEAFAGVSRRALATWLFEPGRRAGQAVPVRMRVKLKFELE